MAEDTGFEWDRWMGVIKMAIASLGMVLSTALYVYGADAAASERIAILETKYNAMAADLTRMQGQLTDIQADIKRLLERRP